MRGAYISKQLIIIAIAIASFLLFSGCSESDMEEILEDEVIWTQIGDDPFILIKENDQCRAEFASFMYDGGEANLALYRNRGRGGLILNVYDWEGISREATYLSVHMAEESFVLNGSISVEDHATRIWGANNNGFWISSLMQETNYIYIKGNYVDLSEWSYKFISDQFQEAGIALEKCAKEL